MTDSSRREFLTRLGKGAIVLVGLHFTSGCEFITVDTKGDGEHAPFLTLQDDGIWFWQSGHGITKEQAPDISTADWLLRVTDGNEVLGEIDFATLTAYAEAGQAMAYWKTLRCVLSPAIGQPIATLTANGIFKGIPLHVVLADLDIPADAVKLRTYGADGFTGNIPVPRALEAGTDPLPVLLATELNGRPMTRLRGGPVRLIIPEMWGYKNMKWVERLDFTSNPAPFGVYETELFPGVEGIDEPAIVSLNSLVHRPSSRNVEIPGPDVNVSGIALVGSTSIETVEVSLDEGPFEPVDLFGTSRDEVFDSLPPDLQPAMEETEQEDEQWPTQNVWVTWRRLYEGLEPGPHTITVRATDALGRTQTSETTDILEVAHPVRVQFVVT